MNSSIILFIFTFIISILISSCYYLLYKHYITSIFENKNINNSKFYYNKYFIIISHSFFISFFISFFYFFIIDPKFCTTSNIIKVIDQTDSITK